MLQVTNARNAVARNRNFPKSGDSCQGCGGFDEIRVSVKRSERREKSEAFQRRYSIPGYVQFLKSESLQCDEGGESIVGEVEDQQVP